MYGKGETWVRPKDMFFEKIIRDGITLDRFKSIPDDEALSEIPLELNPKYCFPDLNYSNELLPVNDDTSTFSPSVKAMITLLTKRDIVSNSLFEGLANDDDIEKAALDRIMTYRDGDSLQEIFHLIQIWGGRAGRGLYVMNGTFDWKSIESSYKSLVNSCLNTSNIDDDSIKSLVQEVLAIDMNIKNFGIAFITKHTRFWLYRTLGVNALPIYDSVMANTVMQKHAVESKHLEEYWKVMVAKSLNSSINLTALERQIFKYGMNQR